MVREVSNNAEFMLASPAYERRRNITFTVEDTCRSTRNILVSTWFKKRNWLRHEVVPSTWPTWRSEHHVCSNYRTVDSLRKLYNSQTRIWLHPEPPRIRVQLLIERTRHYQRSLFANVHHAVQVSSVTYTPGGHAWMLLSLLTCSKKVAHFHKRREAGIASELSQLYIGGLVARSTQGYFLEMDYTVVARWEQCESKGAVLSTLFFVLWHFTRTSLTAVGLDIDKVLAAVEVDSSTS